MLASEIAKLISARLLGDDVEIQSMRRLERAGAGDLTLLLRPQDAHYAPSSAASCMLLSTAEAGQIADRLSCSILAVDNPLAHLAMLVERFVPLRGVQYGERVVLQPGVVIGSDAFVYVGGVKIPSRAGVYIGNDVEIGANSCVASGILECTTIGAGSKIDNLVQIGHDSTIGKNVFIAGQSGVAGHVTIGDGVTIGGQAGILPHVIIGAGARVNAGGLVCDHVGESAIVSGSPAIPHMAYLRWCASRKRTFV